MPIYENNLEHLLDELHRIDILISSIIEKWRVKQREGENDFRGLYISDNEINAILERPPYELKVRTDLELEKCEAIKKEINKKKVESIKKGKELRLHILSELFHLSPFEIDALLICLAPELDLKYEKLYSYLQNDVTRKRPTVDLVIKLLCSRTEEIFGAREYFSPEAPLIKNRLIYLTVDGQELPLLSRPIKIDDRMIRFLLGSDDIDQRIKNISYKIEPKKSFGDIILGENIKNTITDPIFQCSSLKRPVLFYFHGPYGTGKKLTAEAACRELGIPLLVADSNAIAKDESMETLKIILREALLQNSSLYLEGFDVFWKEKDKVSVTCVIQELANFPNWIFMSGEKEWGPMGASGISLVTSGFPVPSFPVRKKLWKNFLNGNASDNADINILASKFKFSGGQIRDAILTSHNIAMAKNPGDSRLSMEDLYLGCKAQSNKNLNEFAKKIEPRYTWEDIILPDDTKDQLKEVYGYIKYKGKVYNEWGFDKKLSLGKGLNVLFSGPSGAGKTMAAEIIAREVELDLYKIDLSSVVSKYIGETEKILRKIFYEAETSNAILFFDEADALFGKRTEVRDSHDRYANIEINYLLQKMEEHEGIVILASNFRNNIDEAFLRRMHFAIEFALPDEGLRGKIWKNIFPEEMPLGNNVDFGFLSKFKITGGNIKNIALSSAFLAASNSRVVKMEHIIRASRREFQKMGKLCTPGDFGEYYEHVK